MSSLREKEIEGNSTKDSTCDISHVKFPDSHGKEPSHGTLLRWTHGVLKMFWLGTVYLQDLDQERFGIYTLHSCSTWSKTSLPLHESDNIQISKISTPFFNKVIRAYLQVVDRERLHILTQHKRLIRKRALHCINRTTNTFLKFQPLFLIRS